MINEFEVYRRAIADYGKMPQKIKAIEEMAELIEALTLGNVSMITEEMADVSIMLSQLELIYDNSEEVAGYKRDRSKRRARKIKPIAELSKLIQVIAKGNDLCLVAEKMADAHIMLDHLKAVYFNSRDVETYRRAKLERLDCRLDKLEEGKFA
jgi:hypothetical protein